MHARIHARPHGPHEPQRRQAARSAPPSRSPANRQSLARIQQQQTSTPVDGGARARGCRSPVDANAWVLAGGVCVCASERQKRTRSGARCLRGSAQRVAPAVLGRCQRPSSPPVFPTITRGRFGTPPSLRSALRSVTGGWRRRRRARRGLRRASPACIGRACLHSKGGCCALRSHMPVSTRELGRLKPGRKRGVEGAARSQKAALLTSRWHRRRSNEPMAKLPFSPLGLETT
eukprot:362951-Chlamydomonas_euryale.AAC.4